MEKLRISENGRFFVKADGTPFPWLADTVWTMPQRMKWDDVEYLMQKRKSQGFTVLQIVALDPERDVQMRTPAGDAALSDGDLDRLNEKYFAYLDWILDKAEEYGFYVLLLPVWGQLVVGDDWAGGVFPKTVTEENGSESDIVRRVISCGVSAVTASPFTRVWITEMSGGGWPKDWRKGCWIKT